MKCPSCNEVFELDELAAHIISEHGDEEVLMTCPLCEIKIDMFKMQKHLDTEHADEMESDECDPEYIPGTPPSKSSDPDFNLEKSKKKDKEISKFESRKERSGRKDMFKMQKHLATEHNEEMQSDECDPEYIPGTSSSSHSSDPDFCVEKSKKKEEKITKFKGGNGKRKDKSGAEKSSGKSVVEKGKKKVVKKGKIVVKKGKKVVKKGKKRFEVSYREGRENVTLPPLPPLKAWVKAKKRGHRKKPVQRSGDKCKRKKKQCPKCALYVIHLPRHLRDVHEFTHGEALNFVKREKYFLNEKVPKRPLMICPLENCNARVQWIQQHLWQVHNLGISARNRLRPFARHVDSDISEEEGVLDVEIRKINAESIQERHEQSANVLPVECPVTSDISSDDDIPLSQKRFLNVTPIQDKNVNLQKQSKTLKTSEEEGVLDVQIRRINAESIQERHEQSENVLPVECPVTSDISSDDDIPLSQKRFLNVTPIQDKNVNLQKQSKTLKTSEEKSIHEQNLELLEKYKKIFDRDEQRKRDQLNEEQSQIDELEPNVPIEICDDECIYKSYQEHPVLQRFYDFLVSVDCGKKAIHAESECKKVFIIWQASDPTMSLPAILDCDRIRDNWYQKFGKQPGTKASYVSSLRNFWSYLRVADEECEGNISKLMLRTDRWVTTINKEKRDRENVLRAKECQEKIVPEEIERFVNSEFVTYIKSHFEGIARGDKPGMTKVQCFMRNYLMLMILITNGQRTGAIMSLNLRSVEYAQEKDNGFVMTVCHHKTSSRFGPATLFLSAELYMHLQIYIKHIRPLVPGFRQDFDNPDAPVFLATGQKSGEMSQSLINNAIQSIWVEVTKEQNKNISATKLRKSTATACRTANPQIKDDLALQMTHATTTADKYYMLTERQNNSVKVVNFITKIMTKEKMKTSNRENIQTEEGTGGAVESPETGETEADLPQHGEEIQVDALQAKEGSRGAVESPETQETEGDLPQHGVKRQVDALQAKEGSRGAVESPETQETEGDLPQHGVKRQVDALQAKGNNTQKKQKLEEERMKITPTLKGSDFFLFQRVLDELSVPTTPRKLSTYAMI